MQATPAQIMDQVTVLCSTFPLKITDEGGIKARFAAYLIALEGCDINDLKSAVGMILRGIPEKMTWSPSAPELAQLVRDAKARREHPHVEAITQALPDDLIVDDKARAKRVANVSTLLGPMDHSQWVAENIKWGTIKPYVAA